MRRLVTIVLVLAAAGGGAVLAAGAGEDSSGVEYKVEVDNAFGLIKGGDLKVAGVRAGQITDLELDRKTNRALVGIRIDQVGFGSLREDVRCEIRPQSLIGEYFVDCLPGTGKPLEEGATVPVEQTGSTVAPDLVNTVLRKPYRERFSIILGELGAGLGGNGDNLQAALRRAVPALRETDKVLEILAGQNKVLADLVRNADRVVGDLADNRNDVGRFVKEAGDTSAASAERDRDIAAGFRELPGFLRELTPSMRALGRVAEDQGPALRDLRLSAGRLETLFDRLGPFARASTPAFKALGDASAIGRQAAKAAGPVVDELGRFTAGTPELAKNLAITLEHLDDRDWAVEPGDPRSPGGKGYTGLEALLAYVYDQTLSTNVFDSTQHYLKVAVFESECAQYRTLTQVKADAELEKHCGARVGPNGYGFTIPDPTIFDGGGEARRTTQQKTDRTAPKTPERPSVPAFREPVKTVTDPVKKIVPQIELPKILPDIPPIKLPKIGLGDDGGLPILQRPRATASRETQSKLLDYLLGG